jgi:hypothetical protein
MSLRGSSISAGHEGATVIRLSDWFPEIEPVVEAATGFELPAASRYI